MEATQYLYVKNLCYGVSNGLHSQMFPDLLHDRLEKSIYIIYKDFMSNPGYS